LALPAHLPTHSPEAYLALDRQAEFKSEYVDGYIVAMTGGSANHSRLKFDLARIVGTQLLGRPCEPFDSDLRLRVDPNRYTYPDMMVVCGESQFEDTTNDTLLNPTVIFEVLSPSTEAHDRGEKWGRYRQMATLQQYVLVSQDQPLVEVFTRTGDVWTFSDARGLDAAISLESIGVMLALDAVYARIAFDGPPGDTERPAID
jgi:Uma2 family endonuclease